jgi:hypothetical protein
MSVHWKENNMRGTFEVSRPRVVGWKLKPEDRPCNPRTGEAVNVPVSSPDTYPVELELIGREHVEDPDPLGATEPASLYYGINFRGELVFVQSPSDGTHFTPESPASSKTG